MNRIISIWHTWRSLKGFNVISLFPSSFKMVSTVLKWRPAFQFSIKYNEITCMVHGVWCMVEATKIIKFNWSKTKAWHIEMNHSECSKIKNEILPSRYFSLSHQIVQTISLTTFTIATLLHCHCENKCFSYPN